MQDLHVLASAGQPGGEGSLTVAKDPFSGGSIQPKGSRRQHHGDLLRGSFQTVQGSVAPSSERRATDLTTKGLDALSIAMGAIPDQGVDASVCDPEVRTRIVGTGEALGVHAFRGSRRLLTSRQGRTGRGAGAWGTSLLLSPGPGNDGAKKGDRAAPRRG